MSPNVALLLRMVLAFAATFVAVWVAIFLYRRTIYGRGADLSATSLSLLIASTTWSFIAMTEYMFAEDPYFKFHGITTLLSGLLVVSILLSPLTVFLGAPICIAYLYARKSVPSIAVYAYVLVVMSVEYGYMVALNGPRY